MDIMFLSIVAVREELFSSEKCALCRKVCFCLVLDSC